MAMTARIVFWRKRRRIQTATLVAVLGVAVPIGWSQTTPALAESTAQSCSLYASNSGSDNNAGSQAGPFRSLRKLASSLKAGETGCLQSGETFDGDGNVMLEGGETHGKEGQPVTITSTDPASPATITHSLAFGHGVDFVTFTHVDFNWSVPKPWVCWNAEGNIVPGEIINGPGSCIAGTPHAENAVQIALSGKGDSLTYDEITNDNTNICIVGGSGAEGAVLEHDVIHNCGPTVEATQSGFPIVNEETGWHSHGVYNYGHGTIIKNDYIYNNSRDGVLLYGGGEGAVVEHNVIDHNGAGIWFGNDKNDRAAWNIITNSTSPRGVADYGIGSNYPGSGNVATNNCLDGNLSGEIEAGAFTSTGNRTQTDPLYISAEQHEYTLRVGSPCLGYGPDTAQPEAHGLGEAKPILPPVRTVPQSSPPAGAITSPIKPEATRGSTGAPKAPVAPTGTPQKHEVRKRHRPRLRARRAGAASTHRRSHRRRKAKSARVHRHWLLSG